MPTHDATRPFNPESRGFTKMTHQGPGGLLWFERLVPGVDLSGSDPLRLNVFLTRDGDFTTIWFGFIDPFIAEFEVGVSDDPEVNFSQLYESVLFRGDISEDAFGAQVLKAIRTWQYPPNRIHKIEKGKWECRLLSEA